MGRVYPFSASTLIILSSNCCVEIITHECIWLNWVHRIADTFCAAQTYIERAMGTNCQVLLVRGFRSRNSIERPNLDWLRFDSLICLPNFFMKEPILLHSIKQFGLRFGMTTTNTITLPNERNNPNSEIIQENVVKYAAIFCIRMWWNDGCEDMTAGRRYRDHIDTTLRFVDLPLSSINSSLVIPA